MFQEVKELASRFETAVGPAHRLQSRVGAALGQRWCFYANFSKGCSQSLQ